MRSTWHTSAWQAGAWRTWLTDHGSLTRRLQQTCRERCEASAASTFRVHRLFQGHATPQGDEALPLGMSRPQHALVREVLLLCNDTPWVFAHTVIPLAGLRGPWAALVHLGNRPLGAALFANPRIQRHPLAYRQLDARHPLFKAAIQATATHLPATPRALWARRSRFTLQGHAILVTEVFLPTLIVNTACRNNALI